MQKGYWVTRKIISGPIGEMIRFFVPGERPSRSARRLKAELRKQRWNDQNAARRVAQLIHANFRRGVDYLVGFDYDDAHLPEDRAAATKQLRNWLERVRRECKKAGVEFRYICVTSDMDAETGEVVRLHHHAVINAEALEIALRKWTAGGTYRSKLDGRPDKTELAKYLVGQARRDLPEEKKYIPSRNLVRPVPKDRITGSTAEIRPPRHAVLVHRGEYVPGRPQYIRFILPEYAEEEDAPDGRITGK